MKNYTEEQVYELIAIQERKIGMPFVFMIRGEWSYGSPDNKISNWFKSLKML